MTSLLSLKGVTKTYCNGDIAAKVLHGISLDIDAGEFVAITGQSGSGKSTLMNILGCLDEPTDGDYRIGDDRVRDLDSNELAALRRETFGFIFQSYNLIPTATARENVELPAIYAGLSAFQRHARAKTLLRSLKLGDRMDHRPNQLSGGQQQRVSIARAIMNGGQVILADEPTGALDRQSGSDVMALLRNMNDDGRTVIVITHSREVAEQADRVIEIRDGRIVADQRKRSRDRPAKALAFAGAPADAPATTGLVEAVRMAFRSLQANFFRTVLTLLGIIIGVGSVVAMLAIGTGAQDSVLKRISEMGSDLLIVYPSMANVRGHAENAKAALTPADAEAILRIGNVAFAVPEMSKGVTVRRGSLDYQTTANGIVPQFATAKSWRVQQGQFLNDDDLESYAPVAVIGQTVARTLFPEDENPIGQYLIVDKVPFQVIGVMAGRGAGAESSDQDDVVFVPLTTGSVRLFGETHVRSITVQVMDATNIDVTQQEIQALLDQRHGRQDTQIANMSSVREAFDATLMTMKLFLASVAAISLLVGGIGVMNIMLVSVTERTREIGVRMATGATRRDILLQFIVEALVVCSLGGVIGAALGLGIGVLARLVGVPVSFTPAPVLLAFACAFLTGLLFGFLPARSASRLHPAVALGAD